MSHFAHLSEENYLKALFKLSSKQVKKVNNIALAKELDLNPATVLEMVRKLSDRKMVQLMPDKTIHLTEKGRKKALLTIRKHRLWEVFLVDKLNYQWSEVHELAEQLEHIESEDLVNRLDAFLGFPASDPHGDPIPDKNGKLTQVQLIPLKEVELGKTYIVQSFAETADSFLDYLSKVDIRPAIKIKILDRNEYDQSLIVVINKKQLHLSEKVAKNILVKP
ncbi:metal-dependent transcriptional regulator [Chitinophagaceae bacterium LB-8]|uniref:Transcriptional regulator MntR n=1 Tax=Paraflavisolibacter caeni TaxID=2982496 RepID=A0A9X3BGR9_9BACT|nr:metal-dependent transcriptional regulator [Paraflavisolibacter caeni]MCU7548242.1 metal-dependent transcriptional regulator [Paraflavisolibacter caeni]